MCTLDVRPRGAGAGGPASGDVERRQPPAARHRLAGGLSLRWLSIVKRGCRAMSEVGGKAEIICSLRVFRILTPSGLSEAQGSQFALLGVPVLLEIDYKLVAKMTKRLLECVCRQVSAEGFQRLGLLADRLAVRTRADDSRSDRAFDAPREIHFVGWHHFIRDQTALWRVSAKRPIK